MTKPNKEFADKFIADKINEIPGGQAEGLIKLYGINQDGVKTLVRVSVARKGETKSWAIKINKYFERIRDGISPEEWDYTVQGRVAFDDYPIYKSFEGIIWPEFEAMPTNDALEVKRLYEQRRLCLKSKRERA